MVIGHELWVHYYIINREYTMLLPSNPNWHDQCPGQCGCLFFPNFQLALIKIFFEFIGNNFYPPEILPVPSLNRRSKRANWFPFHSLFTKGGKRMKSKLCTFFRPLLLLLLSDGVSYPTNRISVSWFLEVAYHWVMD